MEKGMSIVDAAMVAAVVKRLEQAHQARPQEKFKPRSSVLELPIKGLVGHHLHNLGTTVGSFRDRLLRH